MVQRGAKKTLTLIRLRPARTRESAPGPGPIRMVDWKPVAEKHLEQKNVILHTAGAQSYHLKVGGMVHDRVVHQKRY